MGDEMGDMEMGGELGDEMGDMGMGDELGDEMGMEEPCPECNPDGEMEEGDPACELCAGEGFVAGEDGGELDVGLEDEMGGMDGEEGVDIEGEGIAMADLMHRMQDYMTRYMAPKMGAQMGNQMGDHMDAAGGTPEFKQGGVPQMMMAKEGIMGGIGGGAAGAMMGGPMGAVAGAAGGSMLQNQLNKRHMSGGGGDPNMMYQKKFQRRHQRKFMGKSPRFQRKFMGKNDSYCREDVGLAGETHDNFLASLTHHAKGEVHAKKGVNEDALFQIVDPNSLVQGIRDEPQPGDAGFAPQGRVGEIGGGYTPDDFSDLPTLGESRYITLSEFIAERTWQELALQSSLGQSAAAEPDADVDPEDAEDAAFAANARQSAMQEPPQMKMIKRAVQWAGNDARSGMPGQPGGDIIDFLQQAIMYLTKILEDQNRAKFGR